MQSTERYPNLDGMRAYAALGVALMHIAANGAYTLSGVVYLFVYDDLGFLAMLWLL